MVSELKDAGLRLAGICVVVVGACDIAKSVFLMACMDRLSAPVANGLRDRRATGLGTVHR